MGSGACLRTLAHRPGGRGPGGTPAGGPPSRNRATPTSDVLRDPCFLETQVRRRLLFPPGTGAAALAYFATRTSPRSCHAVRVAVIKSQSGATRSMSAEASWRLRSWMPVHATMACAATGSSSRRRSAFAAACTRSWPEPRTWVALRNIPTKPSVSRKTPISFVLLSGVSATSERIIVNIRLSKALMACERRCRSELRMMTSVLSETDTNSKPSSVAPAVPASRKKSCQRSKLPSKKVRLMRAVGRASQAQLAPDAAHRLEAEGEVLVEIHAQLGGAAHHVLAAHVPRKIG